MDRSRSNYFLKYWRKKGIDDKFRNGFASIDAHQCHSSAKTATKPNWNQRYFTQTRFIREDNITNFGYYSFRPLLEIFFGDELEGGAVKLPSIERGDS